ncbi:unnamed protein product [Heterobilharzia americana]|nr:unnamed protein product [Heterobilharzia americana]
MPSQSSGFPNSSSAYSSPDISSAQPNAHSFPPTSSSQPHLDAQAGAKRTPGGSAPEMAERRLSDGHDPRTENPVAVEPHHSGVHSSSQLTSSPGDDNFRLQASRLVTNPSNQVANSPVAPSGPTNIPIIRPQSVQPVTRIIASEITSRQMHVGDPNHTKLSNSKNASTPANNRPPQGQSPSSVVTLNKPSSCFHQHVLPLLQDLQDVYSQVTSGASDSIANLAATFQAVDASSPQYTTDFLSELLTRVLDSNPRLSANVRRRVLDRLRMNSSDS